MFAGYFGQKGLNILVYLNVFKSISMVGQFKTLISDLKSI